MSILSPDFYEADAIIEPVELYIGNNISPGQLDLAIAEYLKEGSQSYDREMNPELFCFAGLRRWFTKECFAAFLSSLPAIVYPRRAIRGSFKPSLKRSFASQYHAHPYAVTITVVSTSSTAHRQTL